MHSEREREKIFKKKKKRVRNTTRINESLRKRFENLFSNKKAYFFLFFLLYTQTNYFK